MTEAKPVAVLAADVPPRVKPSIYPEPFYSMMKKREKRTLGDVFGLSNFGVNLTRIMPGGQSALRHYHSKQDEFIYIVSGTATLITDAGETVLTPGMCAGFKAGVPDGHVLTNRGTEDVVYLEVGDRTPGDTAAYPDDDIAAELVDGTWQFSHKDGSPYR
jgi:uncharacterized cupin superfamily protein